MLFEDIATRLQVVDAIRVAKPDVILTHDPGDYHPDHRVVSRLVLDASFLSGLPQVRTQHECHPAVQPLIYFDTLAGAGFVPTEYVDVTDTFAGKQAVLQCHAGQFTWMSEHDAVDLVDLIQVMTRVRGLQCGVRHAEAFRIEGAGPYRLLP